MTSRENSIFFLGWRREGHVDIVLTGVDEKTVPLPCKIVMMRDGGDRGLGDELRQRQGQGDIHGDGKSVFGDDQINRITIPEMVQVSFEMILDLLNAVGGSPASLALTKYILIDRVNVRMFKVGLFHQERDIHGPVQLSREVETVETEPGQHLSPFVNLQGDPVGSRNARGDESA